MQHMCVMSVLCGRRYGITEIDMKQYKKAGIVACSNGLPEHAHVEMEQLKQQLAERGIEAVFSDYIYRKDGVRSGTAKERAQALMEFYKDSEIEFIFDVSGGDIGNEVLPYLDFQVIADATNSVGAKKEFWGYSDLSVLLNGIYQKTGNPGMLYQMRNLVEMEQAVLKQLGGESATMEKLRNIVAPRTKEELLDARCHFIQGDTMSGIVVGGNIRCLLKLAGTEYFPDMSHKILFLEALNGLEPQIRTYFAQLKQLGVFEQIAGLYVGTFTQWENEVKKARAGTESLLGEEGCDETHPFVVDSLIKEYVPTTLPVARTTEIGHASDSKALYIGKELTLSVRNGT